MKVKTLNLLLIIASLFGYLEWGKDQSSFLFQIELDILQRLFTDLLSVSHPFTIIPIVGQIVIFITLFQKEPSKKLTYIGIAFLSLLLGLMLFIGIISLNIKILLSTLPFFAVVILIIRNFKSVQNSE